MIARVWKYELDGPLTELKMPEGANVLSAAFQEDVIVVWARVTGEPDELRHDRIQGRKSRLFRVVNTGSTFDPGRWSAFVATVTHPVTGVVWHVFEVVPNVPA